MHHHEVATAGQTEIDMHYGSLLRMADSVMIYKYIIKNVARQNGLTATFMPKPLFGDNGSGCTCTRACGRARRTCSSTRLATRSSRTWRGTTSAACSSTRPRCWRCARPTTNSYRRLVPGFEAPVNLAYSQRNRSAACRIPVYSKSPKAKRIEFRPPDPTCNPYLAFAALLMAGLDGVQNRIDPGEPMDKDLYGLPPEEAKALKQVPGSLGDVIKALEADHDFLLKGDVFTEDMLNAWISYKVDMEVDPIRLRPHPHEFTLYYDV